MYAVEFFIRFSWSATVISQAFVSFSLSYIHTYIHMRAGVCLLRCMWLLCHILKSSKVVKFLNLLMDGNSVEKLNDQLGWWDNKKKNKKRQRNK